MIDDFINNFVQYEGISKKLPSQVNYFKCISQPFFIQIPDTSSPIYTLNRVTVRVNNCKIDNTIQSWNVPTSPQIPSSNALPIGGDLDVTVYYTSNDLSHSVHSTSCTFSILELIRHSKPTQSVTPIKPHLYVEDIFAYSLDSTHIYGNILLLALLP